jgi:cell division protein FtsQ
MEADMSGKKHARRRRDGHAGLIMLVILAICVWLILKNYVFVIRNVEVHGTTNVSETEVVRLSNLRLGTPLRSIDEKALALELQSDGRLALIGVETRYPSTVILTVRERTKDALIVQSGRVLLLDSDAYVVEILNRLPEQSLPYVSGLRAANFQLGRRLDVPEDRIAAMKVVIEALKTCGATGLVSELDVENPRELRITTRTGMTVLLGNTDNMIDKIIWMNGAVRDLESRGQTNGTLDVASGTKADYLPGPTPTPSPTPAPTATPEPEPTVEAYEETVIGNSAI